jgi:hypothetical protein
MPKFHWLGVILATSALAQTQVTIYNQNFAVVKEQRVLNVQKGVNEIRLTDITAHLEPDSVILRDLQRGGALQILEQNYESDPLSESLLLSKSEGKVVDFEITNPQTGEKRIVKGRVIRSGYVPHVDAFQTFGQQYANSQQMMASPMGGGQPIIEVDGKTQFSLPGQPVFSGLDPAAFLKPTLLWRLMSDTAGPHQAEFSYITGGMAWSATYNAVAAEKGDAFDLTGWVTLQNASGKDFENTSIKLMAGDVARAQLQTPPRVAFATAAVMVQPAEVTEKAFDEYHLYTLPRPTTLLDREIKQVEFLRALNVAGHRLYVYEGFTPDPGWFGNTYNTYNQVNYAGTPNTKIRTELEFKNSEANHLGMPLPAGVIKLYRRDSDGRNEFIGESAIDHTPKDETTRLYVGNAFDLAGERRQTNFVNGNMNGQQTMDETFEIKVRNHKTEPVEVRVDELLYRGMAWEITAHSMDFIKLSSRGIEFRPTIPPNGEAVITYTVHYRW